MGSFCRGRGVKLASWSGLSLWKKSRTRRERVGGGIYKVGGGETKRKGAVAGGKEKGSDGVTQSQAIYALLNALCSRASALVAPKTSLLVVTVVGG